ncbi:MAG: CBS domain-containing protein [Cyanobacteria bacterium P01_A01_bin.17]
MPLDGPQLHTPLNAIDPNPLVVAPDASLVEVIGLMSQSPFSRCELGGSVADSSVRSSCVLIMQGQELQGIFTERDIVRLAAENRPLEKCAIADVMIHPVKTLPQGSLQDVFAVLFLFRRYRIRHLPIVDESDRLVGVISSETLRKVLKPANLLKLRRVAEVMTVDVVQADPETSVLSLAQQMAEYRVSCVVIVDHTGENPQPVGIVTERDIVQFQSLQLNLVKQQAQAVMSTPLFLLSPEDSLSMVQQEMQQRRVRRFVVSWNWGQGLGIVTQTSLLKVFDPMEMYSIIETLQRTVQQLEAEKANAWKLI